MNSRSARPKRQRGVALVVALLVFALCATLLVALQRDFLINYKRVSNVLLGAQRDAYLRGAEELAARALALDAEADAASDVPRDSLDEIWAQPPQPYPLDEGGWLIGGLEDLQGRFNLNSLGGAPQAGEEAGAYSAPQQIFIRLLQSIEGAEMDTFAAQTIVESIADWIDPDSEPRLNGAEAPYYIGLTPSYRPADRPMASVSELRAVANVTPEIYEALRPLVTVWPQQPAKINIHTAPPGVLQALNVDGNLEPLRPGEVQAIVERRSDGGFTDLAEFLQQPEFNGASTAQISEMLGETSSYFLLTARVEIADREARRYSVLRREADVITVIQRLDASFYDLPPSPGENQP
ncbi:MAG: type II secretion system minor pseudopilin GspK [Pseudomonadota bacterium]